MKLLGIKFAPLNISFERRLQTLAAGAQFLTIAFGSLIGYGLAIYLVFYTRYWINVILYVIWIWFLDKDTCHRGGRPVKWVRNLSWWKYMRDYFPINIKKGSEFNLDPKRNYLFCCFPHGILSTSAFCSFATNATDFSQLFPSHNAHLITLNMHFFVPFFREFVYSLGMCSSSQESIKWILQNPNGGNVAAIMIGGVAEAFHAKPGQHRLVLKDRKGFIKIALKTGSPIVPVYSFGETELYTQLTNPLFRKFQYFVKRMVQIAPIVPIGRGFLQYTFGLVPKRIALTTLIGSPIEVQKTENPTENEINELHQKFIDHLVMLFEQNKHKYISNSDEIHLEIC